MKKALQGFQQFIVRGNVVDLAVGVIIGAAFNSVVQALVKDIITPFIAAIFKAPDFSKLTFTIHKSQFFYGDFINVLLSFILVAATVYFFIILPMNALNERLHRGDKPADPTVKNCPQCLSEIPINATRCAHCTQPV